MGCCGGGGPPYGIPIEEEEHNQLPDDVKTAWTLFDEWWTKVFKEAGRGPVDETTMPDDVKAARELILKTPIPGFEPCTCADSCYMIAVQMIFDSFKSSTFAPDPH